MQIHVVGHDYTVSDAEHAHIEKKFEKLKRHFKTVIDVHVTLKIDKPFQHTATGNVTVPGREEPFHAEAHEKDMYTAVDAMAHKLLAQVDKYKDHLKEHRNERELPDE
jgi:putative sigma-54 modulation protein